MSALNSQTFSQQVKYVSKDQITFDTYTKIFETTIYQSKFGVVYVIV